VEVVDPKAVDWEGVEYNKVQQEMRDWLGAGDSRSWDDRVLGVCSTRCMQYSVYAVLGVCSTRCMQYSVYAVLSVYCTQC
jgi:hypothetical protein